MAPSVGENSCRDFAGFGCTAFPLLCAFAPLRELLALADARASATPLLTRGLLPRGLRSSVFSRPELFCLGLTGLVIFNSLAEAGKKNKYVAVVPGFRCASPGAIFCRLLRRLVELLLHQDFSVSLVNSGALDQPAKDVSTAAHFGPIALRFRKHLEESAAR
jgi:hypothetical protein